MDQGVYSKHDVHDGQDEAEPREGCKKFVRGDMTSDMGYDQRALAEE